MDRDAPPPAISLRKPADFITLGITLVNDSRQSEMRTQELYATVGKALERAGDGPIELQQNLSRLEPGNFLLHTYGSGRDTSGTQVYLRIHLSPDISAEKLAQQLIDFAAGMEVVGRTLVQTGSTGLAIANPERFRYELVDAIAADLARVKQAMGDDVDYLLLGVDGRLQVLGANASEVEISLPYSYRLNTQKPEK
jgi:hypothetical protein